MSPCRCICRKYCPVGGHGAVIAVLDAAYVDGLNGKGYGFILLATILEGVGIPALSPMLDKLIAINVNPKERSRTMAFLYLVVLLGATPFGWIGGQMSEFNRSLPFLLNICLYIAGAALVVIAGRRRAVRA